MLELESLGPLNTLEPGANVVHMEEWTLFRDVPQPQTEKDVEKHILPHL